jgi:hypothetical protein
VSEEWVRGTFHFHFGGPRPIDLHPSHTTVARSLPFSGMKLPKEIGCACQEKASCRPDYAGHSTRGWPQQEHNTGFRFTHQSARALPAQ